MVVASSKCAAATPHALYMRASRFESLDGLRFLSIVPVVWHHSTPRPLDGVLGRGPLGVDLFFAISGFLITTLMLRERRDAGAVSVSRFYARRCLRIFPLYYAVLGLYALRAWLLLPDGAQRTHFLHSLPFFATYTSNWFVDFSVTHPVIFAFGWSLAAEEQFYLLWPWVLRLTRGWGAPVAVALLLLAIDQSVERGLFVDALPPGGLLRRMAVSIATPICMGALLAHALHHPRAFAAAFAFLGGRASSVILLALLALLVCADGAPLVAAQLAMTLLVGACCVRPDHALRALTDAAPVRWIGSVSYGVYMLHVAAITAAKRVLPAAWSGAGFVFALGFGVALLLAAASHRWFEARFLRLRDRLRPGVTPSRAPA
jgi:peptidoglycan/LPS O-acetylase OafA/YrhL